MRIRSIEMKNFRGFADATVDLDRPLTVLAGINGAGKTSLIDAIIYLMSLALMRPLRHAERELKLPGDEDIRVGSEQALLLAALRRTFPRCELIVTTHSPQVLSEVPNDAVLLVKDFKFYRPAAPTEGGDSNAILWVVLGVPPRPVEVVAELDAVLEMLDDRAYGQARAARRACVFSARQN